jgi:hypothetical protein
VENSRKVIVLSRMPPGSLVMFLKERFMEELKLLRSVLFYFIGMDLEPQK